MSETNKAIQDLLKLWKFFKWLDDARWNSDRVREKFIGELLTYTNDVWKKFGFEELNDFDTRQLVLSHWLTYIFDFQRRVEEVWGVAFPIIARIVKEFQDGKSTNDFWDKYVSEDGTLHLKENCDVAFRHHFATTEDHRLIDKFKRTLLVLERKYNNDLIDYMVEVSEFEIKENGQEVSVVKKLACGLYLLTYDHRMSADKILKKLNDEEFKKYYKEKRNNFSRHKRLWSALRDYVKGSVAKRLENYVTEKYGNDVKINRIWHNPEEKVELELPGDRWNDRFYERVILPLAKRIGVDESESRKGIRKIYNKIHKDYKDLYKEFVDYENDDSILYPEQFDVSFDYTRVFCERNLCTVCPLYKGNIEIEKICFEDLIKDKGEKTIKKYCPILVMLGYMEECKPHDCPVRKGEVPKICKGVI